MWPKLVLLDRDGVINADSPDFILEPDAFEPLPGSLGAIAKLSAAQVPVMVCTNQSAVGRGLITESTLASIHHRLQARVAEAGGQVTAVFHCPHGPEEGCRCRKPEPGLIEQALERQGVRPEEAVFIGDSMRDLEAAGRIGVPAWLVRTGNGKQTESMTTARVPTFDDLASAVESILENRR